MSRLILTSLSPTLVLTCLTQRAAPVILSPHSLQFSIAGPKGDVGKGMIWRGDYDSEATYAVLDGVVYNGSSYVCKVSCTGVVPTTPANWSMMAAAAGEWESLDLGQFV